MTTSQELFGRATRFFPGGVNSPVRAFKGMGCEPLMFSRAEGAFLYDVEGKQYVDFCGAFGPLILGHASTPVTGAIIQQASLGTIYGACHPGETELAEHILKGYPFFDRVRLMTTGTESTMTAVRLARSFKGCNGILKFEGCYHGHSDGLLVKGGSGLATLSEASSKGIPPSIIQDTFVTKYGDLEAIENIFSHQSIAAVLLEPIPANFGLWIPTRNHIAKVCEIAWRFGSLVIFDEVITGFRLGFAGATGYYDLKPDLVTLGKVIGGGLPVSALVGPKGIMDQLAPVGEVYQAGTFSSNPLSVAAGCAQLAYLRQAQPYAVLADRAERFCGKLNHLFKSNGLQTIQIGSIFWLRFGTGHDFPPQLGALEKETYSRLFRAALKEGVYFPPSPYEVCFLSTSHTEDVLTAALERLVRCHL